MKYISTRHNSPSVGLIEALWHPLAPDNGLYLPESVPELPKAVLDNMAEMSMAEIGYVVFKALLGEEFTSVAIKKFSEEVYSFPAPMVELNNQMSVLELFEGPTLAFKDFGARAIAGLLRMTTARHGDKPVNILIATTGNTGSAIANALAGVPNMNVFVVFPRGTATRALESQFTTRGGNIYPIEVSGSIDSCHTLVVTAMSDMELNERSVMLSVSSGNIARLIGQTVYYFYGVSRMMARERKGRQVVVSLPAGNLGNLTAGILAKRMGLDINHFIACENANNYLSRALLNDDFVPHAAQPTLAYAADKSVPTNIERLFDLYKDDVEQLLADVKPVTVSDAGIIEAINECYSRYDYLLDPHTALAYYGLNQNIRHDQTGLILATAHPAKSLTAMSAITGRPLELPLQLNKFMGRPDYRQRIKPVYSSLREIIIEKTNK
ncbi:MAG: threonine synthase [Muribaculaceae bacterium]|nr:threonine synthase [Muribaculaceae bacterium]